jgi:hypothetical protein
MKTMKSLPSKKALILLSVAFLFLTSINKSDAQNFLWAKGMGGTSYDNGLSIATDGSGSVYTTGYFQGTADFDPGPGTYTLAAFGGTDIFVTKSDASGNLVWAKQIGGPNYDYARSITVTGTGKVYLTGYFAATADFDTGAGVYNLTSTGSADIFVCKLDGNGALVWAKQMGGTSDDYAYSIALDGSENVYTTGLYQGTADFNPSASISNLTSAGSTDIFVSKLDLNGNFIWAKSMGSTASDLASCITVDFSGDVYTSGYFQGTADFDPGVATYTLTSAHAKDIFISKLDAAGNFVWAKKMGGGGNQGANSIKTDALGNVYTTGSFVGVTDFDPSAASYTLGAVGVDDIFVSKLDAAGNFVWAKGMGSSGFDYGYGISIDVNGDVYTTGEFDGTADFDPNAGTYTLVSTGASNLYIHKLDAAGNFIWAKSVGSSGGESHGNAIATDAIGYIYTTGYFTGTADFDPNAGVSTLTSQGSQADVFILKLGSCTAYASPVNITPTGNLTRCQNESTTLTATGSGTVNWYSSPSSTTILNSGLSYTVSLTSAGTLTYYASSTNSCGAESDRTAFSVSVNPSPIINVTSTHPLLCVGDTANLTASGATSYVWFPGGSGASILVSPSVTTSYSLNGVGNNGCSGSNLFTQNVSLCNGLNQLFNDNSKIIVFPNPSSTHLTVMMEDTFLSATIFNTLGEFVKTETMNTFSIEHLPSGLYLLQITTEKGTSVKHFVKE